MKRLIYVLVFFLASYLPCWGDPEPVNASTKKPVEDVGHFELGGSFGYPIMLTAVGGYWGKSTFPIVARAGIAFGGFVDLGVLLNPRDDARAYFVLSAGVIPFKGLYPGSYFYVGPSLGVTWNGFWMQAGIDYNTTETTPVLSSTSVFFHTHIGYSYFF